MLRIARVLRYVALGSVGVVALCVLLVAVCLWVVTQWSGPRTLLAEYGIQILHDAAEVDLEVTRVHRLDPWGAHLEQVRVRIPAIGLTAEAAQVRVSYSPWALLFRDVRFPSVLLRDARGHFAEPAEKSSAEGARDLTEDGPAWQVNLERVVVQNAHLTLYALPNYQLKVQELEGAFTYREEAPHVWVEDSRIDWRYEATQLLEGATLKGQYLPEQGGYAQLTADLEGAPLSAAVRLPDWQNITLPIPLESLSLEVQGLRAPTLVRLGLADALGLNVPLDLHLHARHAAGPSPAPIDADVVLRAGEALLRVEGRLSADLQRIEAEGELRVPSLRAVYAGLPESGVSGRTKLRVAREGARAMLTASFRQVHLGRNKTLVSADLRAALSAQQLEVQHFELFTREATRGTLWGSGKYTFVSQRFEGTLRARDWDLAPVRALSELPVHGRWTGQLYAASGAAGRLELSAHGSLAKVKWGEALSVERIAIEMSGSETKFAREASCVLKLSGARAFGVAAKRIELHLDLQEELLKTQVSASGANTSLAGEIVVRVPRAGGLDAWRAQARLSGRLLEDAFVLKFDGHGSEDAYAHVEGLDVTFGASRLHAQGHVERSGKMLVFLEAQAISLRRISELAGYARSESVHGSLGLRMRLIGDLTHPVGMASLDLSGAAFGDMKAVSGQTSMALDANKQHAIAIVALRGGEALSVEGQSEWTWPEKHAWPVLFREGYTRSYLRFHVPAEDLPQDAGLPELQRVSLGGTLNVEGSLRAPSGHLEIHVQDDEIPGHPITLDAVLSEQKMALKLRAEQVRPGMFQLLLDAEIGLPKSGLHGLLDASFAAKSFDAEARFRFDSLDRLQGVMGQFARRYHFAIPVQGDGIATVHKQEKDLEGQLSARFEAKSSAVDKACGQEVGARGTLSAELSPAQLRGSLSLEGYRGGHAFLQLSVPTPWLLYPSRSRAAGEAVLDARGENMPLPSIPYLCSVDAGHAGFALHMQMEGQKPPESRLDLRLEGLSSARAQALSGQLSLRTDAKALRLQTVIRAEGEQRGRIFLELPLRFRGLRPGIARSEPVHAEAQLSELPVGPLMQFTKAIGGASGALSGNVQVSGTLNKPEPSGYLDFQRVSFIVASLAQPIRELTGRVSFAEDRITFQDLEAQDRDGVLRLSGHAKLEKEGGASAAFKLKTERLPLRRQGKMMGTLSLGADVTAKIDSRAKLTVDAGIRYGNLQFLGSAGKAVQDLDRHPDVVFRSELDEAQTGKKKRQGLVLRELEVHSKKDLWIRHRDFNVQLGVKLALVTRGDKQSLVGEATIARGRLKLLGKSLTIQRGTVRFTEDSDEPVLDLRASFDPPGGGIPLAVQVSGRASHPVLSFSGAADNADKAFAILSGMNAADAAATAQADVNSFGLGLTAGLVSMTARQELGAWVPTLSVGSNSRGEASQARAGFDASKLIPEGLRGFARGAYVEGIVGETREGPGGSVGLGVRFELSLPRSVVTTVTYGPGTNWSADVAWVP